MVQDNDLSGEVLGGECRLVLGVGCDVSSLDVLNGDVLDVEANVVSGNGLGEGFVVHFNGLDLSGQHVGGKSDDHTRFDDASFDTTNGHCSNTADFVDILERQSQRLVGRSGWRNDGVQSFQKGGSLGISFLTGDFPSLVPGHVGRGSNHVVAMPSGNGDKGNSCGIVSDLLDERLDFLDDFIETSTGVWWFGRIHLVDSDDELFDTQSVSQKS